MRSDAQPRRGVLDTLGALPAHPFLFATLFVVYLLAENLEDQVPLGDVMFVLGISLGGTLLVFGLLALVFRNVQLGAALATCAVLWVFTYGFANDLVVGDSGGEPIRLLYWGIGGLVVAGIVLALRRHVDRLTVALNFIGTALLVFNLAPVVPHQIATLTAPRETPRDTGAVASASIEPMENPRDIYYIILDRYPSQATLMSTAYGYDNSPFLDELERRGFYVAEESRANYIMTSLSVASSLNMDYLDAEALEEAAPNPSDWKPVYDMLAGSLAAPKLLEDAGYTQVQIPSWWAPTAAGQEVDILYKWEWLSEFADTLLDTTVVPRFLQMFKIEPPNTHVANAEFQFDKLKDLDGVEGPKFVFAHILLPHPPYVFDENGPLPPDKLLPDECCDAIGRFLKQLQYTNRRVLEVVADLQSGPDESDPIIMIQADEGPRTHEGVGDWTQASQEQVQQKFGILNAVSFPGADDSQMYPSITPVNEFRVMFNTYFGTELPVLDDRIFAWAEGGSFIYRYVDITERFVESQSPIDEERVEYDATIPDEWDAGVPQTYEVTVTNTGETVWPAEGDDATAIYVDFVPEGDAAQAAGARERRIPLEVDVAPGESQTVEVTTSAPDDAGTYRLRHRMAHGYEWFREGPEPTVNVVSTPEKWFEILSADYDVAPAESWAAGQTRTYEVTVTNTGSYTWNPDGPKRVRLGVHFSGESDAPDTGWATDQRFELGGTSVAPGEQKTFEVTVTAPTQPGAYVLRHRLVKESTSWFDEIAATDVTVAATVVAAPPEPEFMPPLLFTIWLGLVIFAVLAWAWILTQRWRKSRRTPPR